MGIRTTPHKVRHYSATELIRAGVDVRTVAGRLGHSDGGTTLAYYAAWVRGADQRASRILMRHLPVPRPPTVIPPGSRRVRPPSPYQVIAGELRTAILDGALRPGSILPTVKQFAARHHVAPSTIHRAIAVLAHEHPVTVLSYANPEAGAVSASGLINIAKTPPATCPPNSDLTTASITVPGLASVQAPHAECTLDPGTGHRFAPAIVAEASVAPVVE